jgi:hypothetical protein
MAALDWPIYLFTKVVCFRCGLLFGLQVLSFFFFCSFAGCFFIYLISLFCYSHSDISQTMVSLAMLLIDTVGKPSTRKGAPSWLVS